MPRLDLNPDAARGGAPLAALLRADLADAGFTPEAARTAWARASQGRPDDPAATLARLLARGMPVPAASVDAALPRTGADGLVALGLAERAAGTIEARALVRPHEIADTAAGTTCWWIASDLDEAAVGGPLPADHVVGVGGASLTLAGLQLTTPAERVLDLGAGGGIQALRARMHAGAVVATDISARALAFTRLNARLNGIDGIETRLGSLFEPVRGERFDRVVSNPPFVITPRGAQVPAYEYRDGGLSGDDLVAAVVGGVGAVLVPGGTAQLLGNWEYRDGADGLDRVREWVDASPVPLDAWVVERERLDPLAYAELWVRDGGTAPGSGAYAQLVAAWLADFTARGVTAIGFGFVVLRRRADAAGAAPLRRFERVPQPLTPAAQARLGIHAADVLAAADALARLDDDALARSVLVVAGDVTEARHHLPGAEAPSVIELRQGGGLGRVVEVDPALAALVGACDGDLAVGPLVEAIAELLEVEAAQLRADLLPRVRELVVTGFLRGALPSR